MLRRTMAFCVRQAKDGDLIAMKTEIRKRAERRLGELVEEGRRAGRLATGREGKREALGSVGRANVREVLQVLKRSSGRRHVTDKSGNEGEQK